MARYRKREGSNALHPRDLNIEKPQIRGRSFGVLIKWFESSGQPANLDGPRLVTHDWIVGPKDRTSEKKTLGDILYREKGKALQSEREWVELVESIAGGDQLALHSLYQKTHRVVFTLMVRMVTNRETAEELTVDVFHDIWRKACAYDPVNGTVLGWIMNQARSRAIDRLRFDHRKKRVHDGVGPIAGPATDDPQERYQVAEQSRHLRKALEALTPEERQAIETAYFSESTYSEVAQKLNQPLGTVKTRIRSGLAKLRAALAAALEDA